MRTAPRPGPASSTAVRTARATSNVSTSRVVPLPSAFSWAAKASRSLSWTRLNACALVPLVGMPYSRPACRLEVDPNPAMYAARALATAAISWVRREPISMSGRPSAAFTIRDAAEAIAQSWLRIASTRVSRTTASANGASTTRIGEPGK